MDTRQSDKHDAGPSDVAAPPPIRRPRTSVGSRLANGWRSKANRDRLEAEGVDVVSRDWIRAGVFVLIVGAAGLILLRLIDVL